MKSLLAFTAILAVVCCVYAQSYRSSYDPYDNYNGLGLLTGSRLPRIRSGRLTTGRLLGGTRRLSRLGHGTVYRPSRSRYINTGASYSRRRPIYQTQHVQSIEDRNVITTTY